MRWGALGPPLSTLKPHLQSDIKKVRKRSKQNAIWDFLGEPLGAKGLTFGCYFGDCFRVCFLALYRMAYLQKVGRKDVQEA